jgi:L-arabinokinase
MAEARAAGRQPALFGAKITGGGSGGTVCILGLATPEGQAAVEAVAAQYAAETGHVAKVFAGSSMGAADFRTIKVRRKQSVGEKSGQEERGANPSRRR